MSGDRTVSCLVCGKRFPRGVLDLARHTTAVTLKHLIKRQQRGNFTFNCAKCNLYFASKDHLDLHFLQVCPSKARPKPTKTANGTPTSATSKAIKHDVVNEDDMNGAEGAEADEDDKYAQENAQEEKDIDRTMECLICGKLFPRGPIDLARHQTGNSAQSRSGF